MGLRVKFVDQFYFIFFFYNVTFLKVYVLFIMSSSMGKNKN